MDINDTDNIKDLYSADLISSEAYLFCLDNSIRTVSDIEAFLKTSSNPYSTHIKDDLTELIDNHIESQDENKQEDNDLLLSIDAYQKYRCYFSTRTQTALKKLEEEYSYPSKDFFNFLLRNPYTASIFKTIDGVGYQTYNELTELVSLINKEIYTKDAVMSKSEHFELDQYYQKLKIKISVRARNILNRLEIESNAPSFAFVFSKWNKNDLEKRLRFHRNAGDKTIQEIIETLELLKNAPIVEDVLYDNNALLNTYNSQSSRHKASVYLDNLSASEREYLQMYLYDEKDKLSVRSKNALDNLLKEHESVEKFCEFLLRNSFDFKQLRNVGKKSVEELDEFRQNLRGFIASEKDSKSYRILKIQKDFGFSEEDAVKLCQIWLNIEYFPLFAALDIYITSLDRDCIIINGRVNIFENQALKERDIIATQLNITQERVRQLQLKAYEGLIDKVRSWVNKIPSLSAYRSSCSLDYHHSHRQDINNREGVNFNDNFLYKVLQIIFSDEYVLIGDENDAFFNPYNKFSRLFIIPSVYADKFDFSALRDDIKTQTEAKVYDSYDLIFDDYLLRFFKSTVDFESLPLISDLCKKIIFHDNALIINEGVLTIEQNATKSIPDILEDILKDFGRTMSLNELHKEIENRNPGLTKDLAALRGNVLRNNNIVAIGRSGNYVLKEWEDKGIIGGTIRDIAFKFLNELPMPVSLSDLEKHITRFRPETDAKSIYANLLADKTTRFKFFAYRRLRYVGLIHKEYPAEYQVFSSEEVALQRRTFKESIEALERFIKANSRFPFSVSDDTEEERLFRFLNIQKEKKKKQNLDIDESDALNELEKKYGHLRISKKDFLWKQKYDEVIQYVAVHGMMPTRSSDLYLYNWIYNQRRALIESRLNDEQANKIIALDNSL